MSELLSVVETPVLPNPDLRFEENGMDNNSSNLIDKMDYIC